MDGTTGVGEAALEALAGTIPGYGTEALVGAEALADLAGTGGTTGAGAEASVGVEASAGPVALAGAEALDGTIGAGVPLMVFITTVLVSIIAIIIDNMHIIILDVVTTTET
jgi:hypothetical protein